MINMIGRVLEYYTSNTQGVVIDGITLIGLGADFSGLSKLLTNELNHKVRVYTPAKGSAIKTAGDTTLNIGRYAACIGAALGTMNLIPEQKLAGRTAKVKEDSVKEGVKICLILCAIAVALAAFGKGSEIISMMKQKELNKRIEELQPAKEVHDEYVQTKANYEDFVAKVGLTETPNNELYAFIEELEQKMPKSIQMLNFATSGSAVTLSLTVDSKVEAAELFIQLRTFDSLANVDSPGITESIGEDGTKTVTLTVNCTYANPAALDAAE